MTQLSRVYLDLTSLDSTIGKVWRFVRTSGIWLSSSIVAGNIALYKLFCIVQCFSTTELHPINRNQSRTNNSKVNIIDSSNPYSGHVDGSIIFRITLYWDIHAYTLRSRATPRKKVNIYGFIFLKYWILSSLSQSSEGLTCQGVNLYYFGVKTFIGTLSSIIKTKFSHIFI